MAEKTGIIEVKSSLLPQGKVEVIQNMISEGGNIAMIGDGVNDAPALKLATVGIAMGTMGSDIAIDAVTLSVMGVLTPTTGALVHNVGSIFVVLNAGRLYNKNFVDIN